MAQSLSPSPVRENPGMRGANTPFSSVVTLASCRLRRTWFLLLMVTLGMVAAVIVACAVPLFFPITTTAGLRGMLRSQPTNAQITSDVSPLGLSTRVVQSIQQQTTPIFQQSLGGYLTSKPQFTIDSSNIDSLSPLLRGVHYYHVYSTSIQDAASHITLLHGRLPHLTSTPATDIEILMTPNNAMGLNLQLGSVMTLTMPVYKQLPDQFASAPVPGDPTTYPTQVQFRAHIVGLFTVNSANLAYWQGNDFEPYTVHVTIGKLVISHYSLLLPIEGLLGVYDALGAKFGTGTPFAPNSNLLTWTYSLDTAHFNAPQLSSSIQRIANLKSSFDAHYAGAQKFYSYSYDPFNPPPFPYVAQATLTGPLLSLPGTPSNLEQYQSRIAVTGVPTFLIAVQIIGLVLFFVSLMTDVLVERQADTVAILRSRGASRGQVFGALFLQGVLLSIVAVLIGIPLAILVVLFITQQILPPNTQDALSVVSAHPFASAHNTLGYAAVVALVILLTMSFSLGRAARMDVLSARRSAARHTRAPLWQRLRLDVVAGVLALLGYLISLYLSNASLSNTSQALVVVPLSLIAPLFLVIGCLLLSLRLLPLLLSFGARIAVRGRSATSMLALAQMARIPQQAVRMTLLLALATGFTLFALVFSASQQRHIDDTAAFQVGADFSGAIPANSPQLSIQDWAAHYRTIPGVTSATAGYTGNAVADGAQKTLLSLNVLAVDSSTFGSTAVWPQSASSQPPTSLMTQLVSQRQQGIQSGVVPVIIDNTVSNKLGLHVGSTLHITVSDDALLVNALSCRITGIVPYIPTLNGTGDVSNIPTGGILIDYQTYNAIYSKAIQNLLGKAQGIVPNYMWVRTNDDASTVTRVRATLKREDFALDNLQDRRALIDQQRTDPLTVTLIGMLSLGIVVTLLLAILGDVLASWLSARTRLTNFVVLRALGTSPRQVASVLGWEQALIYSFGLLLGIAFGTLLASTVVPTLITHNATGVNMLPATIVIPTTLIAALLGVILVFIAALGMMVYQVSKPSMSQTLRLNEDS